MAKNMDVTPDWELYQKGKDYNTSIGYLPIINRNWRAYNLQLYDHIDAKGLPKVKIPMAQRIVRHSVASCMVKSARMNYIVENIAPDTTDQAEILQKAAAQYLSEHSKVKWELLKMESLIRELLLNGANEGDYAAHTYWDDTYDTGQTYGESLVFDNEGKPVLDPATNEQITEPVPILGEFFTEKVDGANVFLGNPNDRRINFNGKPFQPYVIIAGRSVVQDLRKEAKLHKKENGLTDAEIEQNIIPDVNYEEQVGDRGKKEIENAEDKYGKATYVIKYWEEDGKIKFNKSVKNCFIRQNVDTGLTLYPVAFANWDTVKNSYHGQALMTGLIENQIEIDKAYAKILKYLGDMAFPKAIYNREYLPKGPSNKINEAIGYDGDRQVKPSDVLAFTQPGQIANGIFEFITVFQSKTMEMLGASDTVLGNVTPENTSAIVALTQNATVPLESVKANLYQFIEDLGYIWLDFFIRKYEVPRRIAVEADGVRQVVLFDPSVLRSAKLRVKIDVLPGGYMDEFTAMQTLTNLHDRKVIDDVELVEGIPDYALPNKEKLLASVKERQKKMEAMQTEEFEAKAVQKFLQEQMMKQNQQQNNVIQPPNTAEF